MGAEDSDKIVRDSGYKLTIEPTADEEKYRAKYLPDPRSLTDEQLTCTVCSVTLAPDVHRGKTIYVHRALKVLVCEACFNFYGDGCFSTDEDGDDKYCRWCGQGGTLFLCSACNCAFCQKCVKQNLKASVLAELDKDDWKCYFCNPRPLFGCRTICWGALELNKIGMEKEKEKLRKQKERLEKMEERKREKEEKSKKGGSGSEDDQQSTKRRKSRIKGSLSPEVLPAKKTRSSAGYMNGSMDRSRRKKRGSSSESESSDSKRVNNSSRSRSNKRKRYAESSSEEEFEVKGKLKSRLRKKQSKPTSEDSSDEDKKKSRRTSVKKKEDSSEDSDSSRHNKPKKKRVKLRKKRDSSSEDDSDKDYNKKLKDIKKTKHKESCDESEGESKRDKKNNKHNLEKYLGDEKEAHTKLPESEVAVDVALMKKRIKVAVLWLSGTIKDIADLGTLISMRSTKFGQKKVNLDNLKTYDDVLKVVSKLKQLMSGIHSNYEHIEKGLDAQLKPWKVMTGLEVPETDKTVTAEETTVDVAKKNVESDEITVEANRTVTPKNAQEGQKNENEDMIRQLSGLSEDEDSSEELATKALISKASETLEKDDEAKKVTNDTTAVDSDLSQSLLRESHVVEEDGAHLSQEPTSKEDTSAQDDGSDKDIFDNKDSSSTEINVGDVSDCPKSKLDQGKDSSTSEAASERKSESKGQ